MSLIALPLLKQALQISHSVQDDYIAFLCDGATAFLESELGLFFPADDDAAEITEDLTGDISNALHWNWYELAGDDLLLIPTKRPITELISVTDQLSGDEIDSVMLGDMIVRSTVGASLSPGWRAGQNRYRCVYHAGYTPATMPMAIKQAVVMLTARAYEARSGETASGAAGETKSYGELMRSDILALVRPFSRRRMVAA